MWFEYNGIPLKWDLPIGVLFDTLIGNGQINEFGEIIDKQNDLPWCLKFHYKGNTDNSMVKLTKNGTQPGIKYAKFSYINSLKESHVLRMGSCNEILAKMKKIEEDKLIDGIQKHNYELFWEIN